MPCNRVNNVLDKDTTCALCNQPYTDSWHTFWTCPQLQQSEDEPITKSQHIIIELDTNKIADFNRAIIQKHGLEPGQLILPLDDYTLEVKPHNREIQSWDIGTLWHSGYYFGDGSGGKYSKSNTHQMWGRSTL